MTTMQGVGSTVTEFGEYLDRKVCPGTSRLYVSWMLAYLGWMDGQKPTHEVAQAYLESLRARNLKPNTVCSAAHALKAWYKWGGEPIELDAPKITMGAPEYLDDGEMKRLVDACQTPLERALIVVLFDTACRISEVLALKVEDINWQEKLITVTRKGGYVAAVNVSDKGLEALKDWLDARRFGGKKVFLGTTYHQAWSMIKKVGKRIGVQLHPHMLRHSRAFHMLTHGAEMQHVKEHLGHKNISTTMDVYGRLKPLHLRQHIPEW